MIRSALKLLGWVVLIPAAFFAIFLIYLTLTDYKPPAELPLPMANNANILLKQGEPFTVTTFNIGYGGLDMGQDFFMDGGTMSRSSSKNQTEANLAAISTFISETRSDFYILQEVDIASGRSNHINEVEVLTQALPDYGHTFALNYKVPWVPVPVMNPMGKVESGLLTLFTFQSTSHTRFDLPGKENWPVQLFELDRSLIESRFPVDNGKELVLVNMHLSAFDKGGYIRKHQMAFLIDYINRELEKGNYLIIGGDWNHSLPTTDPYAFPSQQEWPEWLQPFPDSFGPADFQWALDTTVPTVRTLDISYRKGVNFLAIIDGFFISPNVEIADVTGHDLQFEHSDHNPVTGRFILR